MRQASRAGTIVTLLCVSAGVAACNRSASKESAQTGSSPQAPAQSSAQAPQEKYPAPRWPSYFKPPQSVEDLMPAARSFVRNKSGLQGRGMGILQPGESVLIVATHAAEPMVMEAVTRALKERKVTVHVKYTYEFLGQNKQQAEQKRRDIQKGRDVVNAGIYQASSWITGQFKRPDEPKAWLKQRRPDLYAQLFPGESAPTTTPAPTGTAGTQTPPPASAQGKGGKKGGGGSEEESAGPAENPREREIIGDGIKAFLTARPEVKGVFWGSGGSTGLRRALYPMQERFLGTFITDNIYNLQSQMSTYPGDVWQLAEEQLLEPLVYTDRVEITDPEGTNLWADITEEMAERWALGAYQRGHLYMFPNQATGRFGYSFVNYPAFQPKWLSREPIARINGTLAGTQGHGGFFPRWEITWKDGFIADVKGGGAQGASLKEFLKYPGINDLTFPYHSKPGYWYLYEIAFGSHPKAFRHPGPLLETGNTSLDRVRSGVIHWGLGIRMWHDPDAPTESKQWADFTDEHNMPKDHGWHTHTYFTTYKVRLRNANKWVTLLDKGHMTSLDNPEVRALASRYGDPDYLLTEDWVPEVPGINAPGDYLKDYAPDPGAYSIKVLDKASKGTYEHYFPKGIVPTPAATAPAAKGKSGGK